MKLGDTVEKVAAILKDRAATHGDAVQSYERVADAFNNITGHQLTFQDALTFMIVLKLVRAKGGDSTEWDHYIDICGYADILALGEVPKGRYSETSDPDEAGLPNDWDALKRLPKVAEDQRPMRCHLVERDGGDLYLRAIDKDGDFLFSYNTKDRPVYITQHDTWHKLTKEAGLCEFFAISNGKYRWDPYNGWDKNWTAPTMNELTVWAYNVAQGATS